MLKIGDFSKLSRISIRMLRHYDALGLLEPKSIDASNGYRYYNEEQLQIASRIIALKDMGFGLSTISEILIKYEDTKALAEFLSIKKTEIEAQAEEAKHRLRRLETTISRLRKDDTAMNYNVVLKTLPERYVASVRKVIPSYDQESILWNTLMAETSEMNLKPDDPCYSLAIFHDEGYKEQDVDVEIQMALKDQHSNTEHVVFKTVSSIEIASAIYKGSYDQITEVNQVVANWVNDNQYEFDGAMFCIYHVSPAQTQNPDEWVTEVCYPVKKRSFASL
ncbi:MerR family transcriptional regulator [Petrocella sp. FN5]|uniref:MerR family transcriptional regulator n=1 Tax=Petrocella sp. FN5 TaxID=3032002 RepID=UPI0023DABAA6|nr:MerR family transcriptional regulator [Petrocella sp. FN5]MDF1618424.1 MerR family transcriptional regulator [Petrocella sp. FN5]